MTKDKTWTDDFSSWKAFTMEKLGDTSGVVYVIRRYTAYTH